MKHTYNVLIICLLLITISVYYKIFKEDIWGNIGKIGLPIATKIMSEKNPKSVFLSDAVKYALRPDFGELVEHVKIHYNAKMLSYITILGYNKKLMSHIGEVYGNKIYIEYPEIFLDIYPDITWKLLVHEMIHVEQMQGMTITEYGQRYFTEYIKANSNYRENIFEKEAYLKQNLLYKKAYNRYIYYIRNNI